MRRWSNTGLDALWDSKFNSPISFNKDGKSLKSKSKKFNFFMMMYLIVDDEFKITPNKVNFIMKFVFQIMMILIVFQLFKKVQIIYLVKN